jgi:uncharacterized protein
LITATFDSNIYVSALEFGGICGRLLEMAGKVRIDTSDVILSETLGVLRTKFGWDGYRLHFARLDLLKRLNLVTPCQVIRVADDPDDNHILECAASARSDFIVTNDSDLLRLVAYEGILIVRPDHFVRLASATPL